MLDKLDTFTRSYIETALWSSNDESTPEGGEPMDANYGIDDIDTKTLTQMIDDCRKFQETHKEDIETDLSRAGHDFWLTRNGHGAGFWDGDWDEEIGERLTEASKKIGEFTLYVGDDKNIHGMKG